MLASPHPPNSTLQSKMQPASAPCVEGRSLHKALLGFHFSLGEGTTMSRNVYKPEALSPAVCLKYWRSSQSHETLQPNCGALNLNLHSPGCFRGGGGVDPYRSPSRLYSILSRILCILIPHSPFIISKSKADWDVSAHASVAIAPADADGTALAGLELRNLSYAVTLS